MVKQVVRTGPKLKPPPRRTMLHVQIVGSSSLYASLILFVLYGKEIV